MSVEELELSIAPEVVFERETNEKVCVPPVTDSEIVRFYRGKTVFLTGATGFFGKTIIEKLLRCCPDLENLFILCRDKKGLNVHERIENIFNDRLFSKVNALYPKCRHKVTIIKGDAMLPNMGISPEDRQLLTSKVNIIIHAAATVRFDEKLRTAMRINIGGTKEMLKLGRECPNLQSFVYVSTAFSHCERDFIDEKFYPMPTSLAEFEASIERKTDEELTDSKLFEPWPNTYAFTKAMAEQFVEKNSQGLPLVVFRPSIVISTYKEPIRGWIDNLYGPTGVLAGAGLGILKTLYCDGKVPAEIVPVDFVVNALIATSYHATKVKNELPIFNFVSSVENPITWDQFCNMNHSYGINIPSIRAFWYYNFRLNKYRVVHWLFTIFLHWIPAFIIDGLCILVGKQAQLLKVYKKIEKFSKVITYFTIRHWYFKNSNTQDLWQSLNENDKQLFPFDMRQVNWLYHSQMNIFGVRTYVIKEDPSTLPVARKRWQRLCILHNVLKYAFYLLFLRIIYSLLSGIFFT